MKWIDLTQGQRTCVDDDVFEWASGHNWYALKRKNLYYAVRKTSRNPGPAKTLFLHREILGLRESPLEANHGDGNGLNNLRENLASVCHAANLRAFQTKQKGTTSRFRGVSWDRWQNRWVARLGGFGSYRNLGRFDSEEEAARARDQAAFAAFGAIAQLNFPV